MQTVYPFGKRLFLTALSPIQTHSAHLGYLILGYEMNNAFAEELKQISNSEVSFVSLDHFIIGTTLFDGKKNSELLTGLDEILTAHDKNTNVFQLNKLHEIELAEDKYLTVIDEFQGSANRCAYMLSRSLKIETAIINEIQIILFSLGAAAIVFGLIVSFVISRNLTNPLDKLMKGINEIKQGNYDYEVKVNTKDEINTLAESFNNMSVFLKEKIDQVTSLNEELFGKNKELEKALENLKKAQEELIKSERLSAVGKMASGIIHDFKNPMTVIKGYIQYLENYDIPNDKKLKTYDNIKKAVESMHNMTQEILEFSRGEIKLVQAVFPASYIMEEIKNSIKFDIEKSEINLEIVENYNGNISVDFERLKRALINIIHNSIEATPKKGKLSITTDKKNGNYQIIISDNGIGMPQEIRETIFEPFVTHGKSKGTGLGMAITKKIIEEHKGKIDVESEEGKGTTFFIDLPIN